MSNESAEQTGRRIEEAVEQHVLSPVNPHGRQIWLWNKLKKEAGFSVSKNTVNKWMRGLSRPRPDAIRAISRVLGVDEVWLSLGRTPIEPAKTARVREAQAEGAVMIVAGLIEIAGGRVAFPGPDRENIHMTVNLGGQQFDAVVLTPTIKGDTHSFIVPEPIENARILGLVVVDQKSAAGCSACVNVLDLTDLPRNTLGGFSVITIERRKDGRFKTEYQRNLLSHVPSIREIAA